MAPVENTLPNQADKRRWAPPSLRSLTIKAPAVLMICTPPKINCCADHTCQINCFGHGGAGSGC